MLPGRSRPPAWKRRVHCTQIVAWVDQIVEACAISDFTSKLHHFHTGGTDVDWDVAWPFASVDNVELNVGDVVEFTMVGDVFASEQHTH